MQALSESRDDCAVVETKRALIVDDHPFMRTAVRKLLEQEGFEVIGEAADGTEAVHLAKALSPDLVVLDIALPGMDGLEVISGISKMRQGIRILVLTALSATFYATRCMKAGAAGYLLKTSEIRDVALAISGVMAGYSFFPSVKARPESTQDISTSDPELITRLSDREIFILQQLAAGWSNKEIAKELAISSKTVSTYKVRLSTKLNVRSVVHLAEFARRNDLI